MRPQKPTKPTRRKPRHFYPVEEEELLMARAEDFLIDMAPEQTGPASDWEKMLVEEFISPIVDEILDAVDTYGIVHVMGNVEGYTSKLIYSELLRRRHNIKKIETVAVNYGGSSYFASGGLAGISPIPSIELSPGMLNYVYILAVETTPPLDYIINMAIDRRAQTIIVSHAGVSSMNIPRVMIRSIPLTIFRKYAEAKRIPGELIKTIAKFSRGVPLYFLSQVVESVTQKIVSGVKVDERKIVKKLISLKKPPFKFLRIISSNLSMEYYSNPFIARIIVDHVIEPFLFWVEKPNVLLDVPTAILEMGPPGTGKSYLLKCIAGDPRFQGLVLQIDHSSIKSKWYGETEKQIGKALQYAAANSPAIVFIDEIDTLIPGRGSSGGLHETTASILGILLQFIEEEGRESGVIIIGATNKPEVIDTAMLNRFQLRLPVLPPRTRSEYKEVTETILRIEINRNRPYVENRLDQQDLYELASLFEKKKYVQRDIRNLVLLAIQVAIARRHERGGVYVDLETMYEAMERFKTMSDAEEVEKITLTSIRYSSVPID